MSIRMSLTIALSFMCGWGMSRLLITQSPPLEQSHDLVIPDAIHLEIPPNVGTNDSYIYCDLEIVRTSKFSISGDEHWGDIGSSGNEPWRVQLVFPSYRINYTGKIEDE